MARSIEQIYAEMIAQKEATPELDGLASNSRAAVWRLIMYVCAVSISVVENLFDLHVTQINNKIDEATAGTLPWYRNETLSYQNGDALVFDATTGNFGYAVEDLDKQIIDLAAAADDSTQTVFIKAAKIGSGGEPEPLAVDELAGLTAYWDQKKFAGVQTVVTSEDPDLLKVGFLITYDATVINSNGELISDTGIKPIENAINNYILTFGVDNFAGIFQLMRLTDAIQDVNGVLNVVCNEASARKADLTGDVDILAAPGQSYSTVAGYLKIDPAYPLVNFITYTTSL